jgi:amidophosphoribosyltransferase
MLDDLVHDNCGVFGLFGNAKAAELTYFGLYSLQHRGQESAGIVTSDQGTIHMHKGMGEVSDVFGDEQTIHKLTGNMAVGHTRYSTTGASSLINIQPFLITNRRSSLAIAHNGNLTNATKLRSRLDAKGSIFQTTSDTEVILHLTARSSKTRRIDRICDALSSVKGAFSVLFLTENSIIAARDSYGFRPLCLGKLRQSWVVASETCAFDIIGARYVRDIEPGEVLEISAKGLRSRFPMKKTRAACCIFEYIYFARPDSKAAFSNISILLVLIPRYSVRMSTKSDVVSVDG